MTTSADIHRMTDVAAAATLLADATRARIVMALADGRSLPASVLAAEAGVSASTTSAHLARLVDGGMLTAERSGRHRYYRLANEQVAAAVEALAAAAPTRPVRSLRESTRAAAVRRARTCYDHLAGQLGVAITEALIECRALERNDGLSDAQRAQGDPFAVTLATHPYRIGPAATTVFGQLGVDMRGLDVGRRPLLRFCVDWSEQRHHLAGALGAAMLTRMEDSDWVRRATSGRSVRVTDTGRSVLRRTLGIDIAS